MMIGGSTEVRILAKWMSALSEDYWCSAWWNGCEYSLWAELISEPAMGREPWGLPEEERRELRLLQRLAGGWIVWSEGGRCLEFLSDGKWAEHLESAAMTETVLE